MDLMNTATKEVKKLTMEGRGEYKFEFDVTEGCEIHIYRQGGTGIMIEKIEVEVYKKI